MAAIPSTDSNGDGKPDARGYLNFAAWLLGVLGVLVGFALAHLPADAPVPPSAPPAAPASAPLDTDAPAPAAADTDAMKAAVGGS